MMIIVSTLSYTHSGTQDSYTQRLKMAAIFRYIAEDPANHSTVKAVDGGDYYIEIRRKGRGRGRVFQTLEEWIMRVEGKGFFTMPDWSHFRAVKDAYLPLFGSFYYVDLECPQENRTLLFLAKRGIYVQLSHGANRRKKYFTTFADWAKTLPVGGRLYTEDTQQSIGSIFWQYLYLYEETDNKVNAAHYVTYFLLINKNDILRSEFPVAMILGAIRNFLGDAKFEYNNILLDNVEACYFDQRVSKSVSSSNIA